MLSYLFSNPHTLGLSLARPLAATLFLLLGFFLLRPYPGERRITWLRCAAFAALIATLAGLEITARLPDRERSVVIAVDVSDSVGADGVDWAERIVAQTRRALAPGDSLDILTFAAAPELLRSDDGAVSLAGAHRGSTASTRLVDALDESLALFAPEGERVLLLLSDGNETDGDSRTRIPALQAAEVTVHAAAPSQKPAQGIRITNLVAPPTTASGRLVPFRLVAENRGAERIAVLKLFVDGKISDSSTVKLAKGPNTIDLTTRIDGAGGHRLRAELTATDDPALKTSSPELPITVHGALRALLITPRAHSGLASTLRRQGYAVDVHLPDAHLDEALASDSYHAVLLEDVRAADLGAPLQDQLESFVRDSGGGLIAVGGGTTFGDEGFRATPLERLLPVTIEARRPKPGAREPLALFLVIDRSNSMGYNSLIGTLRDGEKLRYAKSAALEVIRQLKDQDLVGVIVFDSRPSEIAPLQPLRQNRARLEKVLPRLVENGGTDFYDALLSARDQLARTRITRRHIILLTDGDTNRGGHGEYAKLTKELAAERISVTTIRIGDNTVNLKLLQSISKGTGGSFHHVADARRLPDLMLRETTRAIAPAAEKSEQFFPALAHRHQLLRGLDEAEIPALSDYAYTRPKTGAETLLQVARLERRDPILAVWNYGLGRVAALTASPAEGAEPWLGWSQWAQFWSQLVQWTARQNAAGDLAVSVSHAEGAMRLEARAFDAGADDVQLSARLYLDAERFLPLDLTADEPRLFRAALPPLAPGRYGLTIVRRAARGVPVEIDQTVYVPPADESAAEHRRDEPDLDLLNDLVKATGGVLNPTARDLARRTVGTRSASYPLDNFLVPLAMLLFLADIALRRLRDIRRPADGPPPSAEPAPGSLRAAPSQTLP